MRECNCKRKKVGTMIVIVSCKHCTKIDNARMKAGYFGSKTKDAPKELKSWETRKPKRNMKWVK
jgi:hypothetical protein|tara:strand:- start:743 stop:934 length:192 start_codon:yes stop_codon:yes gene_type:complete